MQEVLRAPRIDPHAEYLQRLQLRRAEEDRLEHRSRQIGNCRLAVFLASVGVWWFVVRPGILSAWWLLLFLAAFFILVFYHEGVRARTRLAKRSVAFYEKGLARLQDRWAGQGAQGMTFLDGTHPYAQDLDLFGKGSLFELLCTARTLKGEAVLASWLCVPTVPEEIRARQTAIEELRLQLDLRERIAILGDDVRTGLHPDVLAMWAAVSVQPGLRSLRIVAAGLASLAVLSLVGQVLFGFGPLPFLAVLFLEMVFVARTRVRVQRASAGVARATHDLALLAQLLRYIEEERFLSPRLVALCAALDTDGETPSRQIAKLRRLLTLLESTKNQIFLPLAFVLLWGTQIAFAIESWRAVSGPAIADWLTALGEFEALCALAGYAYEHPADPFPEIVASGPCFAGQGIGHPLIPDTRCVRNDVSLGGELRVLIVSGSNMSGKSTLLRTVGINVVLALAGAPVRARHLRLSPVALGATLRIQDSLQAGSSRFYAEISRIRLLMDIAKGPLPLLFLLDEILHGTNSHDRRVGAEAIVRSLLNLGTIGLITTHDLALAHIAEALSPRAANVCFEDQLVDGKLVFDYRMRPGVVQRSNALALMRTIGLEV